MICLALGLGLGGLALRQSACAASASCCCKKKQAQLCSCDRRDTSQPAIPNDNGDNHPALVVWLLSQLVILYLLLMRWWPAAIFTIPGEGRARGPTSLGLSALQIALPPPA